jgi:uncharacterized repeat protein (TIGR03943 family)
VRRESGAVVVVALGVLGLRLGLTDDLLSFVKPSMRVPLVLTAVVLVALGVWELVAAYRRPPVELAGHHDHHDAKVSWLLTLPVVVSLVLAPPALGADAVDRTLALPPVEAASLPPLPAMVDGAYPMSLAEYTSRAAAGPQGELDGITVRLTGFAIRDGDGLSVVRFRLSCCAADARFSIVAVTGASVLPADETWLEIEGTWRADPGAVIDVTGGSVRQVDPPRNPYE